MGVLHHLKLIHMDIKMENIMLSPAYKRPVFIDFGLSELIEEDVGDQSEIYYRGSLYYCSDEMKRCWRTKKS